MLRGSKGLFAVGAERVENPDPPLYGKIRHGEKNLFPGEKGPLVITQCHEIHLILLSVKYAPLAPFSESNRKEEKGLMLRNSPDGTTHLRQAALVYSRAGGFPREEPKIFP